MNQNTLPVAEGKPVAIIAYLTIVGLIIAFILNSEKKSSFAQFHIIQSMGIMCTGLAMVIISWVPFIGWLVALVGSLILLVLWISGLISAVNGRLKPVPVLGEYYSKWFAGI